MASKKCCKPFELVKKCSPYTHVDTDDNMLYVSEGRPCTELHYINTKDIVKSSDQRGAMSDLQEKLKKHNKKKYKIRKGSVKVCSQIDKKIEVLKKNLEESTKIVEELTSRLATLEEEKRDLKILLNKARKDNDACGAHEIVDLKNMERALKCSGPDQGENPEVELATEGVSFLKEVKDGKLAPKELEDE